MTHHQTIATIVMLAGLTSACSNSEPPSRSEGTSTAGVTQTTQSSVPVVPAAQQYIDAVNAEDLEALVNSFALDGRVVDVSRTIAGRAAIQAWARGEVIGGTLRVIEVAERRTNGQKLLVHWAPEGSAGWRAHYDFTVERGLIVTADLQYA